MLCNICKENEATVHLTQIVGEKMHKVDLCEICSKDKGVGDHGGDSLASLLGETDAEKDAEVTGESIDETLECETCGFTQAEFKKTGRLGCSDCFDVFRDGLQNLLKTMHRGTEHVGKVPKNYAQTVGVSTKLNKFKVEMEEAIKAEDFEKAAQLRDQIKELSAQLESIESA